MFDAILFEFDGVLADTRAARRAALMRSLAVDGVSVRDDEYDDACAGLSLDEGARAAAALRGRAYDETDAALAALRAERHFAEWVGKGVTLAPGARAFVEAAVGRTRLGVVARASRREVEFVLALAELTHAFECVVTADDGLPPKPSPVGYTAALARLARRGPVRAERVVALEDGVAGIQAARAAGLVCVAVGAMPAHRAMQADALLPSLEGQSLATLEHLLAAHREGAR
jgi:HAD superfamily hydrolase (TIGR01509 family)